MDLLWPREAERLEAHGLKEAKTVLDLGTGNGYFLSRLAERYPKKSFTGIEASPALAALAEKGLAAGKLSNMTVVRGSCPLAAMKDRFDLVLARLSFYCMRDKDKVLAWAKGRLNPGGRIALIDVDDGLKACSPPRKFWEPIVAAIAADIGPDADRLIGRKLPDLLQKAGFSDVRLETQPWYSSTDIGPRAFAAFWGKTARLVAQAQPELFGPKELAKFLSAVEEIAASPDQAALTYECVVSASAGRSA